MRKTINKVLPKIIGSYLNTLSYISPKSAANKALDLFATPRKGKILEIQKSFLDTATQDTLFFEGLPIKTYQWEGEGETILLAHGWESNAFRWHKLVKVLQENNYNIIALDAPAHGNSGSQQFNALLYAEFINETVKKSQPEVIIGHSVGGMASVFFQKKYQYPELEKLILLGAPSEFRNVLNNYTSMLGFNNQLRTRLDELILKRFGSAPESFSSASYLRDIATKGLVIHDRSDKIISYDEALLINENFKNAQLITTEGYGHSLHHDSVNQHVLEFLNS